jgi:hypothetical protein
VIATVLKNSCDDAHDTMFVLLCVDRPNLRFMDVREHGGFQEGAGALLPEHTEPLQYSIGYRHMVSALHALPLRDSACEMRRLLGVNIHPDSPLSRSATSCRHSGTVRFENMSTPCA